MHDLEPKYQARAETRARCEFTAQAAERAKRIATTAADQLLGLERSAAESESAQAAQLAEQIAAGGPSAELPTAVDETHATALASARLDLAIKRRALASLEGAHAKAQGQLLDAEADVVRAVDQIFHDEDTALEKQVVHYLHQALILGKRLFGIAVDSEMNGRRGQLFPETLARLDQPLLDRRHLAINFMQQGDTIAAAARAARRAALIAGDAVEEAEAA
jgi:hypothetical protein